MKTLENPAGVSFQGVEKGCIGNDWIKFTSYKKKNL